MNKEIVKHLILEADPKIRLIPKEEISAKINLIYTCDYLYNPFSKTFYNPKINKELKALVVYNLSLEKIDKLLNHLDEEFIKLNKNYTSDSDIINIFNTNSIFPLKGYEIIFALFFFTVGVFIHLFYSTYLSLFPLIVSLHLFNYFVFYNSEYEKIKAEEFLNPLWISMKNFLLTLTVINFIYFIFLLKISYDRFLELDGYLNFKSFIFAIVIFFIIKFISDKDVKKSLTADYWKKIIIEKFS